MQVLLCFLFLFHRLGVKVEGSRPLSDLRPLFTQIWPPFCWLDLISCEVEFVQSNVCEVTAALHTHTHTHTPDCMQNLCGIIWFPSNDHPDSQNSQSLPALLTQRPVWPWIMALMELIVHDRIEEIMKVLYLWSAVFGNEKWPWSSGKDM